MEEETFCIYCQKQYASAKNLEKHVMLKHPDTYRAMAYKRGEK